MGNLTEDEKRDSHNRGQKDAANGKGCIQSWKGPLESEEHHNEWEESYKKGYHDTIKNMKK